ncbi:efflux RND transporter permease subunit [Parvularcula oceani]|uniref:efflux RND transporter permease subunit n=1 Tax=Parvularcula oceani TaxID=1247963 RepID=UPI00055C9BF8|nr:efflux RND transporter permease subunit [Parvularcula oceani]
MNGLIAWWARNGVAANLLMILIFIVGLMQFATIDREAEPSPPLSFVDISVSWPGAGPREVEEQIVMRIEEALADLDGIKEMQATATEGYANVFIEMRDDGRSFEGFLNQVKARVDGVSNMPQDAFPPVVRQFILERPLSFITFSSALPDREHNRLAREIRDEIAALPDATPLVDMYGDRAEEVSIEVSESALRRYGLTFDDIAQAIRASSINRAAGTITTDTGGIALGIRNLADTRAEFERIVVRQNRDGSVITVGDVATVIDGFTEARFRSEVDDQTAITIVPRASGRLNIVTVSKAIEDYVEAKQDELPPSAKLFITYDTVEDYRSQMELVGSNAFVGLILVLIVLTLFLRPVVAAWVAAGIAISFIGTFIFLPTAGVTLNFLSLFGILLVIGIVVDDALVVGESIHRQTERGRTGLTAAVLGTQIVAKPVLFAVLTTMIAFAPFILISGPTAEFTKHIAWPIIFALSFSLIESFLILPSHLSHMKEPKQESRFARFQAVFANGMVSFAKRFYRPLIIQAVKFRYITVFTFLGLFWLSVALLQQGWVPFSFQPEVEGRSIVLDITPQEGSPYARNVQIFEIVSQAVDELREEYEEEIGRDIIVSKRLRVSEGGVNARIILTDADERGIATSTVGDRLRELIGDIPDAEDISLSTAANEDAGRFYASIEADSLDALQDAANDIKDYLRTVPELYDVRDSLQSPNDELQFTLKPGAERFGITLAEVSRQVRQAYFGEEVQRLPRSGEDVRVMVRYPREVRESLESLDNLRIRTPDGRQIPFSAVADTEFSPGLNRIQRVDRQRSVSIFARMAADADRGAIQSDFYGEFAPDWQDRHPGVTLTRRGAGQEQDEFFSQVLALYGIALFAMYMLLAIAFGSYFQPILIMSAIPFGFMGAMFGHALTGTDFAMFSVFGIAAAGGVVVNDNLVLIDYVNRLRDEGAGAFAALVEAGTVRFRPIILTSLTTFVGLVPILLEQSVNAKFLQPMIIALAFGVFFALFVTLIFVPALYAVGIDIARLYKWGWTGTKPPSLGDGASQEELPDIERDHSYPGQAPQPAE